MSCQIILTSYEIKNKIVVKQLKNGEYQKKKYCTTQYHRVCSVINCIKYAKSKEEFCSSHLKDINYSFVIEEEPTFQLTEYEEKNGEVYLLQKSVKFDLFKMYFH